MMIPRAETRHWTGLRITKSRGREEVQRLNTPRSRTLCHGSTIRLHKLSLLSRSATLELECIDWITKGLTKGLCQVSSGNSAGLKCPLQWTVNHCCFLMYFVTCQRPSWLVKLLGKTLVMKDVTLQGATVCPLSECPSLSRVFESFK